MSDNKIALLVVDMQEDFCPPVRLVLFAELDTATNRRYRMVLWPLLELAT